MPYRKGFVILEYCPSRIFFPVHITSRLNWKSCVSGVKGFANSTTFALFKVPLIVALTPFYFSTSLQLFTESFHDTAVHSELKFLQQVELRLLGNNDIILQCMFVYSNDLQMPIKSGASQIMIIID
jgi:hypothetical protein